MKTQRFLPVLATVILAGAMFLAGCEKEKKTEDISESNYNTIPLEEYLEGTWICPQSAGPGINWTDTFVFNHETWFNNCSNQYRKYRCSNSDKDTVFVYCGDAKPSIMRLDRLCADSMIVYDLGICNSFIQILVDKKFIRSKK